MGVQRSKWLADIEDYLFFPKGKKYINKLIYLPDSKLNWRNEGFFYLLEKIVLEYSCFTVRKERILIWFSVQFNCNVTFYYNGLIKMKVTEHLPRQCNSLIPAYSYWDYSQFLPDFI